MLFLQEKQPQRRVIQKKKEFDKPDSTWLHDQKRPSELSW